MRKLNLILAAVLLGLFLGAAASAASFTASLDRDTVTLGENATLSLKFDDGSPPSAPSLPEIQGINIGAPTRQFFSSDFNGIRSASVVYSFPLIPQHDGEFAIPTITADVNGQQLASQPLKLIVQKVAAPSAAAVNSGNEVAFMKLILPRQQVHAGEIIVGQLQLYLRDDVQNFGNFRFTSSPADGFSIGKMIEAPHGRQQVGNRIYNIVPLSVALTAVKTGDLTVGPLTAGVVVVLPSQNQGGDPFSQFFNRGEQRQVSLTTDQINVQSLPLPTENVPANFNGAVGNYKLTVTAGPTNVAVGDPITVRVQIAGRGALDAVKLPDQSGWSDFKLFPPTSKVETSDALGLEGTKTFEEIVTPQNADVRALPPFSFSFFNPDDGKYHTLAQAAVPLAVRAVGATMLPALAANKNSAPENQTPQDILPIKENLGTLTKNSAPLVSQPAFLAAQTLPVLAFLGAFIWRKRTDNLANNPRLRRRLAVETLIQNGLTDLRKFAAENKSDEFFALLFRLLQEQLGERLDCSASAITENVVEENSILRGKAENLRNDLRELFQLCNQARYAPVRGTRELNSVAAQFENAIAKLQNVKT